MINERTPTTLAMFRLIDKRVIIAALVTAIVLSTGEKHKGGGKTGATLPVVADQQNISR